MEGETIRGNASKYRIYALILDNLVATVLAFIAVALVATKNPYVNGVLLASVYLVYFLIPEGLWAQTPGKRLFGLRVVRLDGSSGGFKEAAVRTLFRLVEANPLIMGYLPGGIAVLVSRRRQRLGDWAAGTLVVSTRRG